MAEPNPSATGTSAAITPAALDEALSRYARVPSFLRYTGEYPATDERLKAMWREKA